MRRALLLIGAAPLLATGCASVLGIEELPPGASAGAGGTASGGGGATGGGGSGIDCAVPGACGCVAGETRCASGSALETCSVEGGWQVASCPTSEPACSAGACRSVTALSKGEGEGFCAILSDASLRCWGNNDDLELAHPSELAFSPTPLETLPPGSVAGAFTSTRHVCAWSAAGSGWCWGENDHGELGTASPTPRTAVPVSLPFGDIDELAGGSRHTCARFSTGAVGCWGDNELGELGNGTIGGSQAPTAQEVALPSKAVAVFAGSRFNCALLDDRTSRCWGANNDGMLGDGSDAPSGAPVDPGLTGIVTMACGSDHACAATDSGLYCWGNDDDGQIGWTPIGVEPLIPVFVAMPAGVEIAQLCAGWRHSCARSADGLVRCWGSDLSGQLGDGSFGPDDNPIPSFVQDLGAAAVEIACGWRNTCALLQTGAVRCWGEGDFGQIGDGLLADRAEPTTVVW